MCEPFERLIQAHRLRAYQYDGFWMSMDTFKDRQQLEEIHGRGEAPWQLWNHAGAPRSNASVLLPTPVIREPAVRMRIV